MIPVRLRVFAARALAVLRGSSADRDLEEEIRSHLEMQVDANLQRGMTLEDARRSALREFGGVAQTVEACRERRGLPPVTAALHDVVFALRLCRANPLFTATAVIPLAVAIAFITAVFTLIDAAFWRPMGVTDPGKLVTIYSVSAENSRYQSSSYSEFRDTLTLADHIEAATAYVRIPVNADLGDGTEQMPSELATAGYFQTLGVSPVLGRLFEPRDDAGGAAPVAAISYALWESKFKRSPSALGARVTVNGTPCTIVGVLPRGYVGTVLDWGPPPAFWLPLSRLRELVPAFRAVDFENRREVRWLLVSARVRTSVRQVQAAFDVLSSRDRARQRLVALPFNEARFFPTYRDGSLRYAAVLAAISIAVLFIACFNLASLFLARAAARERETGTRLAIGATPGRMLQQFLCEGTVLSLGAVVLSIPAALWLTAWMSTFEVIFGVPLNLNLRPDWRVLAGCAVTGLGTGLITSIFPALHALRADVLSGLKGAPRGRPARRMPALRDVLVVVQVSCATVMLVSAAPLAGSLNRLRSARLGYDPRNVLLLSIETRSANLGNEESQRLYRTVLADLRSGPVLGAALASEALPTAIIARKEATPVGGQGQVVSLDYSSVSDGYFETLGMRMEAGRGFTSADTDRSRRVALINRPAADLLWPGEGGLGRRIRIRGQSGDLEIIGVVSDAKYHSLTERSLPYLFLPLAQDFSPQVTIHVRTAEDPLKTAPFVRERLARLAKTVPVSDVRTLEQQIDTRLSQVRLAAAATATVGFVGTVLALTGLFGVTAYRVAQGRREIAVRIAIGSGHRREMLRCGAQAFVLGTAGTLVGLAPAFWVTALLREAVDGAQAPGPLTAVAAAGLLQAGVVLTSVVAVRQILRMQPAEVLRVQ